MLNRNRIFSGLVIGLLLPLAGFAILHQLFALLEIKGAASGAGLSENFRERTLAIVAMALNILPMRVYQRRRWEEAIRGLVIATGALALAWLWFFGRGLF